MGAIDDIIATLVDDRDTVETGAGTLRLRVEPTDESPMDAINGYDSDGRVAWGTRCKYPEMCGWAGKNPAPSEHTHRPDGFTGAARKLYPSGYDDPVWWQPNPTVVAAGPDALRKEADRITRLLWEGFCYVAVELLTGEDAYRRPIVADVESLGGLDVWQGDYFRETVRELVGELADRHPGILTPAEVDE